MKSCPFFNNITFRQLISFFAVTGIMKGYVNIPNTMYVRRCKECGARPIIALAGIGSYVVKCPISDNHYHTEPGLIDLEDWNSHNNSPSSSDYSLGPLTVF